MGYYRERITLSSDGTNQQLPDKYTTVLAVVEHPPGTQIIVGEIVTAMKQ